MLYEVEQDLHRYGVSTGQLPHLLHVAPVELNEVVILGGNLVASLFHGGTHQSRLVLLVVHAEALVVNNCVLVVNLSTLLGCTHQYTPRVYSVFKNMFKISHLQDCSFYISIGLRPRRCLTPEKHGLRP